MNEEKHWNAIGEKYDDEIFDVFESNQKGKLQQYFRKHANKKHHATDFGCGNGKALKYLAPRFSEVMAVDISQKLIDLAQARTDFNNISFRQMDLTEDQLTLPPTDFAFCCNVAILPSLDGNRAILANIEKTLRKDGVGLVVVPSLESVLYASRRLVEWYREEGVSGDQIPTGELSYFNDSRDLAQGVIFIDDVPTKHYLECELQVLFEDVGLTITAIDRLEYDWDTEFVSPPKWMKEPYPWDWLIECRKP